MAGFEDGVVRLLELLDPQKLPTKVGVGPTELARLTLQQAFKPHNGPVTAAAYDKNGKILATGVRRSSGGLGSPDPRLQGSGLSSFCWGVSWWWVSTGVLSVCVLVPIRAQTGPCSSSPLETATTPLASSMFPGQCRGCSGPPSL